MNQFIIARHSSTKQVRKFNLLEWDLLGKNKNGWEMIQDQKATSNVDVKIKPSTGEKKESSGEQFVSNEIASGQEQEAENISKDEDEQKHKDEINSFLIATEGFTKGVIKDFFDKNNIKYDNNAKLDELKIKLGEHLKWNVESLAENF